MDTLDRIPRDELLMDVARLVARRGTCSRLQVGAVFSRDGRIIATGYNGAPSKLPHCEHEVWYPGQGVAMPPAMAKIVDAKTEEWESRDKTLMPDIYSVSGEGIWCPAAFMTPGSIWELNSGKLTIRTGVEDSSPCTVSEHAERNGIAFAARHGLQLDQSELHVTHMPCEPCAMSVINAGVIKVTYKHPYRITAGVELMQQAGLEVVAYQGRE